MNVRFGLLGGIVGLAILAGCSARSEGGPAGASSSVSSPASGGTSAALPGETVGEAIQRISYACMDGLGDTNFVVVDVLIDAKQSKGRAYNLEIPDTKAHFDECQKKALAAVPIVAQSKDDLRATHGRLTKIVDCVRDAGFDLGTMVSVDEFVANGGVPDGALTSRWSQFAEQPEFLDNFYRCGQLYPPPPAK